MKKTILFFIITIVSCNINADISSKSDIRRSLIDIYKLTIDSANLETIHSIADEIISYLKNKDESSKDIKIKTVVAGLEKIKNEQDALIIKETISELILEVKR